MLDQHLIEAEAGVGAAGGHDLTTAPAMGRAYASMFLARLGSTRPCQLIAVELGLPAWFAEQPAASHYRLVECGQWLAFLADLNRLATAFENDVPAVDYRTRRQRCAGLPGRGARAARYRALRHALPAELGVDLASRFTVVQDS